MKLYFPTYSPYSSTIYPKVGSYDISDPEPANWRVKILLESSTPYWAYAVCSGKLSAVPPWEVMDDGIAPLFKPNQNFPDTINLYLEPNQILAPQADYLTSLGFLSKLEEAGLGKSVRYYVYENVSPDLLGVQIQQQLSVNEFLKKHKITDPRDRWEMFAKGQVAVWVNAGDSLARASSKNASKPDHSLIKFGVVTTTGYIDPVSFFEVMQSHLHDPTLFSGFKNLVGSQWPFLAPNSSSVMLPPPTAVDAIKSAKERLYPAPALYEAKQRLALSPNDWRQLGNAQKKLYWDRLLRSSGHTSTGSPFVFDVDDMTNPFQLETVAEFFIAWPTPCTSGTAPPLSVPSPAKVDLQQEDWNLVFIDPFNHAYLGIPKLPKPDYYLGKHTPPDGVRCDSANVLPAPFNEDTYNAVLFLVHQGEIKAAYRWSTYSSHQWEGKVKAKLRCGLGSSAVGNNIYHFRSYRGSTQFINYGFMISSTSDGWSVPGKYYFRHGTPEDDGKATGDSDKDKTGVMIHYGLSADSVSKRYYNASGGCFVSPSFYLLRNAMVEIYWEEELKKAQATSQDKNLLHLCGRSHSDSQKIHSGGLKMRDGTRFLQKFWNGKIKGYCFVIRPDEPTQK